MIRDSIYALRLIIYQPHAHYRVPFTYQRRHTYPLPSYSAVRGLLANILGIRGYTFGEDPEKNRDFQKLKGLKVGISGRFAAKSTECIWFRNLSKKEHLNRFGARDKRSVWGIAEHPGGQSPVLIDVLKFPIPFVRSFSLNQKPWKGKSGIEKIWGFCFQPLPFTIFGRALRNIL